MAADVNQILARADRLKGDRSTTESVWEEIRRVAYPEAASLTGKQTPGQKDRGQVLDNSAEQAGELLSAALYAGTTHPNQPWFSVGALGYEPGDDKEADEWLEHVTRVTMARINSPLANFAPQQSEMMLDFTHFGTGVKFIGEIPGRPPLFQARPLGECLMAEGDNGKVDTLYRVFERTARQVVQRYRDKAGAKTIALANDPNKCDDIVELVHATYPRADRDPDLYDAGNMEFASCTVNRSEKLLIEETGFQEFPYACPRWPKRAGEVYGRGAGHKALPDIKMLQRAMSAQIVGVEKMIDPALMVADDGVMSPRVRLGRAAINHVRADMLMGNSAPIKPILTGGRPDVGERFLDGIRERVQFAYWTHLIQFARDPNMTATQFLGITEQTQQVLGPILSRSQVEDCQPTLERVIAIGFRNGWYRPAPPSLEDRELKFQYVSPLTKRLDIGEVRAAAQTIEMFLPLATVQADIFDNFDLEKLARDVAMINGMRATWVRGIDNVIDLRKKRREIAERQAEVDQSEQLAGAGQKAAQALSIIQGGRADAA